LANLKTNHIQSDPISIDLDQFDETLPNFAKLGQTWKILNQTMSNLYQSGLICTNQSESVHFGPSLTNQAKPCPNLIKLILIKFYQKFVNVTNQAQPVQIRPNLYQSGSNWTNLALLVQIHPNMYNLAKPGTNLTKNNKAKDSCKEIRYILE